MEILFFVVFCTGYARQDRKMQARVPISAADVARLLQSMGVDRVVAVDLHCGQIQGFFSPRTPCDNLEGQIVALPYVNELVGENTRQNVLLKCCCFVSGASTPVIEKLTT